MLRYYGLKTKLTLRTSASTEFSHAGIKNQASKMGKESIPTLAPEEDRYRERLHAASEREIQGSIRRTRPYST